MTLRNLPFVLLSEYYHEKIFWRCFSNHELTLLQHKYVYMMALHSLPFMLLF